MKKCSACNVTKKKSYFRIMKESYLRSTCKACEHIYKMTSISGRFYACKNNSKKLIEKGKVLEPFNITKKQFIKITSLPCIYCGGYSQNKLSDDLFCGVDRADSNIGYIISNINSCCWPCNDLKGVLGKEEFLKRINKIYGYQKNHNKLQKGK